METILAVCLLELRPRLKKIADFTFNFQFGNATFTLIHGAVSHAPRSFNLG